MLIVVERKYLNKNESGSYKQEVEIMTTMPLNQRQLFLMKRENLTKRVQDYYQETQRSAVVFEYLLAILVRELLVLGSFGELFKEVVVEILLNGETTRLMRQFCPLFEDYCQPDEWKQVVNKLYKDRKEYYAHEQKLQMYKTYIREKQAAGEKIAEEQFKLVSIFSDAHGKEHTWSLSDADPQISEEKAEKVLNLLTHLTIFEKDGVRRFAMLEKSDIVNCTRKSLIKKAKKQKEIEETERVDDEEKEELVKMKQEEFLSNEEEPLGVADQPTSDERQSSESANTPRPKKVTQTSKKEQKHKNRLLRKIGIGGKKERKRDKRK